MQHVIHDMGQVGGGGPSLKMSAPYLLQFGSEGVVKKQRMNDLINQSINDEGVCRTALAAPGLLNIHNVVCRTAPASPIM